MTFNQEQDYWAGYKVVFEFGIGEAVPLSEWDGFEHVQQGIGGRTAVVSKVTGSLAIQVVANQSLDLTSRAGSDRCVWQSWLVRFAGRRFS